MNFNGSTSDSHCEQPRRLRCTADVGDEAADDKDTEDGRCYCCQGNSCCCCCCPNRGCHRPIGKSTRNNFIFLLTRLCLIIPNAIFILAGLSLTGLGIWMRMDRESVLHLELLRHLPTIGPLIALDRFPVIILAVGCSVAILSLMGCCGACAESACCLCLYTFFLVLVLVADVILVVAVFVMQDQIIASLGHSMQQQIALSYNVSSHDLRSEGDRTFSNYFSRSWDTIQNKFDCCGSFGPGDYELSAWFNRTRTIQKDTFVPASCCHLAIRADIQLPLTKSLVDCQKEAFLYITYRSAWDSMVSDRKVVLLKTQGCHKLIFSGTQRSVSVIVGVICALVTLQIVNFIIACVLLRYVRRREDDAWFDGDEYVT